MVVAGVVPDLVGAAALINGHLARGAGSAVGAGTVKDKQQRRELHTVVAAAADEEIVARTLHDAGRHALERRNHVNDHRSVGIPDPRIDFVNASNGDTRLCSQI